jgi:uncharacterized membrane protein YqjE
VRIWLRAFFVASLLDVLTTQVGFALGVPEGNPAMAAVLRSHGELWMFGLRLVLAAFIFGLFAYALWRFHRRRRCLAGLVAMAVFVVLVTGLTVANNVVQIALAL